MSGIDLWHFLAVKLSDLQVNDKHFNLIGSQNKIMTQLSPQHFPREKLLT